MYSFDEVKRATLDYFDGDDLAANVWIKKYCMKDERGNLLEKSPSDMHRRLSREFARIERKYPNPMTEDEIFSLIDKFKYIIPAGSQMSGIGNNKLITSLSNCFVVDSAIDSYGGIFKTDQEQVQIMKRRGGVGHDISNLRPSGALANNSILGGLAGSTLYMERFSNSTREVAQDGRRGALMLSIDIKHPDSGRFIDAKLEEGKVTGANISVRISDVFMECVKNDKDFIQSFPISADTGLIDYEKLEYNELYEYDNIYVKRVKAKDLWYKIVKNAWKSAEPGVLFWDKIVNESPANIYGYEWNETSTNPCGEIPLCPYDSCRLTAINLFSYVRKPFTSNSYFDFDLLIEHTIKGQRLMDDLIDLEIEKIEKIISKIENDPESSEVKATELNLWNLIKVKAYQGRRTGLGITAEGDMLAALGIKYGSEQGNNLCEEIHKMIAKSSYESSIIMAKERGAFPIYYNSTVKDSSFLSRISTVFSDEINNLLEKHGRRNIANLTIAPTGTISLMTQTTSGIEPLFRPFYKRRTRVEDKQTATFIDEVGDRWIEYFVIHPKFKMWYDNNWYKLDYKLFDLDFHKPIEDMEEDELNKLFEKSPYFGSTSNDIDWRSSVELQGRVQKWIDHSISKTINLPNTTTVDQVFELYFRAREVGCKGITVYRDGSRSGILIDTKDKHSKDDFEYADAYKRPKTIECDIYHKVSLKQNWMVIVGKVKGKPYEIFAIKDVENTFFPHKIERGIVTKVKSKVYRLEGEFNGKKYIIDNIIDLMSPDERVDTRKYSAMLRHRINPKFIIEQIEEYAAIVSFDKVVQRVLKSYLNGNELGKEKCQECGGEVVIEEGCKHCVNCGWSKCS
jgi:ribonucleoside-diphosphate reductase alpha chain